MDDTRRRTRRAIRLGLATACAAAVAALAVLASLAVPVAHETTLSQLPSGDVRVVPAPGGAAAAGSSTSPSLHAESGAPTSHQVALDSSPGGAQGIENEQG